MERNDFQRPPSIPPVYPRMKNAAIKRRRAVKLKAELTDCLKGCALFLPEVEHLSRASFS